MVIIRLTSVQAEALCSVLRRVGGDPLSTKRGCLDEIRFFLEEDPLVSVNRINRISEDEIVEGDTIYFKEKMEFEPVHLGEEDFEEDVYSVHLQTGKVKYGPFRVDKIGKVETPDSVESYLEMNDGTSWRWNGEIYRKLNCYLGKKKK